MTPLLVRSGLSQHAAQAASLSAVVATGVMGSVGYSKVHDCDFSAALLMSLGALGLVPVGARLAFRISSTALSKVFASFLILAGPVVPLLHTETFSDLRGRLLKAGSPAVFIAVGCLAGFMSGLLGVGGGLILTPLLSALTDMPQHAVIGTSLAAMILPSLASLYAHASRGVFSIAVAIPLTVGAALGSASGLKGALQIGEQELRIVFAASVVLTGLRMLLK
jgi:uncharacterized membrane protein YfcA